MHRTERHRPDCAQSGSIMVRAVAEARHPGCLRGPSAGDRVLDDQAMGGQDSLCRRGFQEHVRRRLAAPAAPGIGSTSAANTTERRATRPCTRAMSIGRPICASTTGTMSLNVQPRNRRWHSSGEIGHPSSVIEAAVTRLHRASLSIRTPSQSKITIRTGSVRAVRKARASRVMVGTTNATSGSERTPFGGHGHAGHSPSTEARAGIGRRRGGQAGQSSTKGGLAPEWGGRGQHGGGCP